MATVCQGVMRYVSHNTTGKNLTVDEYTSLKEAGLAVGLVWQNAKDGATLGFYQGVSDALDANIKADDLGYPKDAVIYYANDKNAKRNDFTQLVIDYFNGVVQGTKLGGGRPIGYYGGDVPGMDIIGEGLAEYYWQAAATSWSDTYPHPGACLVQQVGNPYEDRGWVIDVNKVQRKAWGGDGAPKV